MWRCGGDFLSVTRVVELSTRVTLKKSPPSSQPLRPRLPGQMNALIVEPCSFLFVPRITPGKELTESRKTHNTPMLEPHKGRHQFENGEINFFVVVYVKVALAIFSLRVFLPSDRVCLGRVF